MKPDPYKTDWEPEEIRSEILKLKNVSTCEFVIRGENDEEGEELFNFIFRDKKDNRYGLAAPLSRGSQVIYEVRFKMDGE